MKKAMFTLLFLLVSYSFMAQETVKQREIGLVFNNLNGFGLTYKTGTNKSLWRFNTLMVSGNNMNNKSDDTTLKQSSFGFGVKIGREYRKNIVKNLELRFGADLSFLYTQAKSDYDYLAYNNQVRINEMTSYSPGVNLVFGFNYLINEKIIFGAELLPSFNYVTGTAAETLFYNNDAQEVKQDFSGFNYGLSNTSVLLSVAYRF